MWTFTPPTLPPERKRSENDIRHPSQAANATMTLGLRLSRESPRKQWPITYTHTDSCVNRDEADAERQVLPNRKRIVRTRTTVTQRGYRTATPTQEAVHRLVGGRRERGVSRQTCASKWARNTHVSSSPEPGSARSQPPSPASASSYNTTLATPCPARPHEHRSRARVPVTLMP
jgi:hypothetical protein